MGPSARILITTELGAATDGLASAAALAVAIASAGADGRADGGEAPGVVLVEVGGTARRRPTLLSSNAARGLETRLRAAGFERSAARGRVCWAGLANEAGWCERLRGLALTAPDCVVVAFMAPAEWRQALDDADLAPDGAMIRADVRAHRPLLALCVAELRERDIGARVATRPLGLVGARRALAGLDSGGPAAVRMARAAQALVPTRWGPPSIATAARQSRTAEAGQALPLVVGAAFIVVLVALALAAIGGAVTGVARSQRAADLVALSAARAMRDDLPRLTAPRRLPSGLPNPTRLSKPEYLGRARAAGRQAAERNSVPPVRVEITFPDSASPVPVRAHVLLRAERRLEAEAQAAPPAGGDAGPASASGSGYDGPLEYRQGKPMRPDVASAFDRLAAAASRDGVALVIASGYRSDSEQAKLFAANPDPRWVAPPGTSLHRCGTELDLGSASAYAWLAANAPRFGFVKRYAWEPWHFGYSRGPAPCSAAASAGRGFSADRSTPSTVPAFVPAHFRSAIVRAGSHWGVSTALLAAQLQAESGFDPGAVSPAGAQGIAQFMPATAAAYGLRDPFDPAAAIDAQARLMADLLSQFGSTSLALAAYNAGPGAVAACDCVPPYPETQAYVARILALMDGAGEVVDELEVRLVR